MTFLDMRNSLAGLTVADRLIRLRLWGDHGFLDDVMLVQDVEGVESIWGGVEYHLLCVSPTAGMMLKQFIAMPAELQFVTSSGALRRVCGVVDCVQEGESDGGLGTYRLTMRDALSINDKGCNTRIFRDMNEVDITNVVLGDWCRDNPVLARAFQFQTWRLKSDYPRREFTFQRRESDSAFLRRLWKRRGFSWFFSPAVEAADGDAPAHVLILFDDAGSLEKNAAGCVRFHRDDGTEEADSITGWSPVRTLTPGRVTRQSWDYKTAKMLISSKTGMSEQGALGDQYAYGLEDSLIEVQHAGDSPSDFDSLTALRIAQHELNAKQFRGEGGGRDWCPGQWIALAGHAGIDTRPASEREFVLTEIRVSAKNNLPKAVSDRASRLFAVNRWKSCDAAETGLNKMRQVREGRYTAHFTCVRRGVPIVPVYDPRADLPDTSDETVVVIGPEGESVYCDELGRVRVRFPGCQAGHRVLTEKTETGVTEHDSAWVLVSTGWAGARFGVLSLPRVGHSVIVSFLGGDPDKPIIIGAAHSGITLPPSFSHISQLPGDRYLSGIVSQEIGGLRSNQMRLDDTAGQISAQLSSDHAASQLNLGFLTHPRSDGHAHPRGEGAELRSDQTVSVRGAHGVLITADAALRATGRQLERDGLNGLAAALECVQKQLADLADSHMAGASDGAPLAQLTSHLKQWEDGSNTEPKADRSVGGQPIVAVSAPAGLMLGSQANVSVGAQTHADIVSVENTQISAGHKLLMHAMQSISLFAYKLGMKLTAASGKVEIQTHQDDIEITSAKRIVLSAAEEIVIQAPKVTIISQGAQVSYGEGCIAHQCADLFSVRSADVLFTGPGDGNPVELDLPQSEAQHDQRVRIVDLTTGEPLVNQRYRATMEDGQVFEGFTDEGGMTGTLTSSIPFAHYTIEALDD